MSGKTGTSSDYHDAWFIGYTEDLVAGVWLGNDNSTSMNKITGGTIPSHLWHDVMTAALNAEAGRTGQATIAPAAVDPVVLSPANIDPPDTVEAGVRMAR